MTMREWMAENHPDKVTDYPGEMAGYDGGVYGCPDKYGIERRKKSTKNCRMNGGEGCDYCWGREMPDCHAEEVR